LNVDTKGLLEHQPVQVLQIAKVKSLYSYYLGDLVTSNDLAVCYVVRVEEIRVLHNDGSKLLLKGHHVAQVYDIRFSPVTPRYLASVCRGGRVLIWDLFRKLETPIFSVFTEQLAKPDVYANKVAWHHSNNVIAIGFSNDSVVCLDLDVLIPLLGATPTKISSIATGIFKIACSSAVLDLNFSVRDSSILATANHDGIFFFAKMIFF
jgi:WD40 repeat protein